ncbi:MAG TPA: TlpA family protein disulfide reductase [Candidatus Sulfotelmatobacter sp.]|jgi:thiol-disulfide isomerase/thioredoxin|nr:TlpA family protein disulfide reductase [Candidatus Sulfotelmatobacter sp.]
MRFRFSLLFLLFAASGAWAGVVDNVRIALERNNFSAAQAELNAYRNQRGVDGEYLEGLSWMGRAALDARQYDQAADYAKQTKTLALEQLKKRPVDAEPHLPLALGAAFEVQSQVLIARGAKPQAIALIESALKTYGNTSIGERLQKNLNVLSLQGAVAPALKSDQFLGSALPPAAQLKGSPVLLFFWAHWCGDCKAEAPIITQLRSEFAAKGLKVIGPTRFYGYTAQSEHAPQAEELKYIDAVRRHFYSGLLDMPVPISKYNFDKYGASTTPTLVLLDRTGKVAMYHPGALPYAELRAEIEKAAR